MRTPEQIAEEQALLVKRREFLLSYLDEVCRREEDWHGVMDASADLREVEAKLGVIAWVLE
jgi:hypothetical protein